MDTAKKGKDAASNLVVDPSKNPDRHPTSAKTVKYIRFFCLGDLIFKNNKTNPQTIQYEVKSTEDPNPP